MLARLQEFVDEANTTNSSNEKLIILAKYQDLVPILNIIYSDFKQFGVTSKNILKMRADLGINENPHETLEFLLFDLYTKVMTGHSAITAVLTFINSNTEYEELILNAIDKNLKCRVDVKMINKVFPNSIKTFDVALAKDINKIADSAKPDFEKETWFASRKLDGVRCLFVKEAGKVTAYSRTGKEFTTLGKIIEVLENDINDDFVLDGELCLVDENGNEDFQNVMKEIRKKDHTIENPKYYMFDFISLEDFQNKKGNIKLSIRFEALKQLQEIFNSDYIEYLKQEAVIDQEDCNVHIEKAADLGWEGIILRKNIGYEGKRSNNMLKCKKFFDAEYIVKGVEIGKMQYIIDDVNQEIDVMTKVIIEHKGFEVGVGSGWNLYQRQRYFHFPEEIIGKVITVRYFEESQNQNGGISLRFPTCKVVHGEKREV